ncbi:MAG: DUF5698 domain-containing protein [Peptococcaceae bacterium]|nr:DUF5698 domain-containing protein [Peptococcaceae bacterium]
MRGGVATESVLSVLGGYLFIFSARVVDMSLDVVRILMLTRDRKFLAALIGFVEVSVFILAISQVLSGGLSDPLKVVAYAGGFATGNYVGGLIDSKLAMGYLSLQVFSTKENHELVAGILRSEGFGVTTVTGCGRDGEIMILFVTLKRKDLKKALSTLDRICPEAFYNIYDARYIHGGIFPGKKKGI